MFCPFLELLLEFGYRVFLFPCHGPSFVELLVCYHVKSRRVQNAQFFCMN